MRVLDFSGVKVKWLGHDSYRFEFGDKILYIDPYEVKVHDKADIILITHGHYDHCSIPDLKKLVKEDTIIITTPDTTSKLSGKVIGGHMELAKPGAKFDVKGVKIKAVHAYNIDKPFHPKENEWVGYIFEINNIKFYHAGDTDFIPEMADVIADVAFLPVSGTYVMTADEAVQAVKKIRPKVAIPMHYGKIVGEESDAIRFKQKAEGCRVEIME
ncbi:MBL fold metallo-hydrolase [archaeon]|jgi:L-ascorbate metabolism protein UlaG (beta-lactamase superfamily)|nr:MBL fold metallo-hydrolase [archaeon]MBT4022658.1 MBL fold metallo-hydrolase [archaeon]MBT4272098.1 MBL fold metallo-hydrolase [archaeon]MBT4461195.1 MBL fold metallo-hydrolase [archaeon]MBT4858798.1 MBL fold metallo-hydrolase [archaeon]